jgi:two-component system, chemotaxis family, chemotaxis protein CheY
MARVLVVDDAAFMRKMVSDALTMPEKDGLIALRAIIELDPSARVVMCSALGQESKVLESIKLGAKDFVVKPFQADRVLEAVGKALA